MELIKIIRKLIADYIPAWCVICRYVGLSKNMRFVRTTANSMVAMCPKCHQSLFHPFTSEE